jgi:ribokinase
MHEFFSIGDTSHNVFLGMTEETVHVVCKKDDENCQLCFSWADKIPVDTFHETIGGNSANAATSFARLGMKTVFYTHVGKDNLGKEIIATLAHEGMNTDYIVVDQDKVSNYSTVINLHGERSILVYHEHRHYTFPKIEPAEWMYLSSMGVGSESITPDIINYVKQNNTKLCYQPGTFQLKLGKDHSKELLEASHIFLVNKEEAEMFLEIEPTDNFRTHLDGVLGLGAKVALVTDGPAGAYASDGKEYLYLGIIEDAPRNEATGAGDSFSSAFATALAKGKSLSEAMLWGQAQATGCIREIGAQAGLRTEEAINGVLARFPQLQTVALAEDGSHEYSGVPKGTDVAAQSGF